MLFVTLYLDFKVKIFFNIKCSENGTRLSYTYSGTLIGSRTYDLSNGP